MTASQLEYRKVDHPCTPDADKFRLSVVVSTQNASATLAEVLQAIRGNDLDVASYEIIVVDDASTDGSAAIAARYADKVVRLTGEPSGPAYSRNRGAELARGTVIAFADSDVIVARDTLSRMLAALLQRPEIVAIAASRDERSGADNFISRYWNLLLAFGEQRQHGKCAKLAAGFAMVRRIPFHTVGMYDEWRFSTGGMESVELGERLLRLGNAVVLSTEQKVIHLKRWDFISMLREVWHRSKAVARSLGYNRVSEAAPSEVVFTLSRSLRPAAALLGTMTLAAAFVPAANATWKIAAAIGVLLLTNLPIYRYYAASRGVLFTLASAPLHIVVQLVAAAALCSGWVLRDVLGDVSPNAAVQAYSEVGHEIWPPVPRKL
jgi:glycosyltransferase involved in cell wall biosynthesis